MTFSERMTSMRLIDADALGVGRCSKDVLPEAHCTGWNGLIDLIEKAPTVDAVPVVRCRECKHCDPENHHCDHHMGTAAPLRRKPDDFCSYGERKGGTDNEP